MISRREFLPLLAAAADDLLQQVFRPAAARAYRVDAVIVLFGRPIASRTAVGEAMLLHQESDEHARGRLLHLTFAGGSRPERTRGLNRLGYFSELICCGETRVASYFGFMTVSDEKSLAEAARSLGGRGHFTPLAATRGELRGAKHVSAQARLRLGIEACWANWRCCLEAGVRSLPPPAAPAPRMSMPRRKKERPPF